jgi:hypothetical protein
MKKSFSLIFLLVPIFFIWSGCQHELVNANIGLNKDSIVVVVPPANGGSTGGTGGTAPAVSDTVCFNSEVLPLYINYCGSAGCHNETSHSCLLYTSDAADDAPRE